MNVHEAANRIRQNAKLTRKEKEDMLEILADSVRMQIRALDSQINMLEAERQAISDAEQVIWEHQSQLMS